MTLREFLNTNANDWERVDVYLSQEQWDDWEPEQQFTDMREIPDIMLRSTINAWEVDANFVIHVLM